MNAVDLGRALRAATADAPPTDIDVDRLIGAEQRRQRSIRTVGAVCGAGLGVLLIALVMIGLPGWGTSAGQHSAGPMAGAGSPRPCPSLGPTGNPRPYQSDAPSPRAVPETCGEATARLDTALERALRANVPGIGFHDNTGSAPTVRFLRANDENLQYFTGLNLTKPELRGSVGITVEPRTLPPPSETAYLRNFGCDRASDTGTTCLYRTLPDGTVVTGVLLSSQPGPAAGLTGSQQYQIQVYRPDETVVGVIMTNTYFEGPPDPNATPKLGGKEMPLTVDQIIAVGRDAGLTLYP